jgi:hypothetical protein
LHRRARDYSMRKLAGNAVPRFIADQCAAAMQ